MLLRAAVPFRSLGAGGLSRSAPVSQFLLRPGAVLLSSISPPQEQPTLRSRTSHLLQTHPFSSLNRPRITWDRFAMSAKPICYNWRENQACRFGNVCRFAHLDPEGNVQYDGPVTENQICFTFRDTGNCNFGSRCRFVHVDKEGTLMEAEKQEIVEKEIPKPRSRRPGRMRVGGGIGPCWQFQENGECEFGEKCRFQHGEDDARDLDAQRRQNRGPCWQFRDSGECQFGETCVFSHDAAGQNPDEVEGAVKAEE